MSTDDSSEGVIYDPTGSQNLRGTLSRFANSRSRPTPDPLAAEPGLGSRTLQFVSSTSRSAFSKAGLGGLLPSSPDSSAPGVFRKDSDSPAPSFVIRNTMAPDTSSILYPTLTSHPAPIAHPVLVLSLPEVAGKEVDNDTLFDVILGRLEPWVGEEGEGGYVLIVLAGGDRLGAKMPGVGWWAWKWRKIPRKYRKNLKRLYIVHPSLFTRTLLPVILPFLSPKAYAKLHPLPSLLSLHHIHGLSLHGIDVPLSVLQEEARVLHLHPNLLPPTTSNTPSYASPAPSSSTWSLGGALGAVKGAMGGAASYLPLPIFGSAPPSGPSRIGRGYWGRTAAEMINEAGGKVPRAFVDLRKAILRECMREEGVFRRSTNSELVPLLTALLDIAPAEAPNIPWDGLANDEPLLLPRLLLKLLGEMKEPLFPSSDYDVIRTVTSAEDIRNILLPSLDPSAALILSYVVHTLHHVSLFEPQTKMSPLGLAIVLAPNLIRGPDPLQDAAMCVPPGKSLPSALANAGSGNTLVGVLKLWIEEYVSIASPESSADAVDAVERVAKRCSCPWVEGKEHPTPSLPSTARMGGLSPSSAKAAGRHELLGGGANRQRRGSGSERSWTMIDA